jgi:hypothetical protein
MSAIFKNQIQARIDAATVATPSLDLAQLRYLGTLHGCTMTNLDTVTAALADSVDAGTALIEMSKRAKSMPPAPVQSGNPATEIGGIAYFSNFTPHDFTVNGARYLKTGFIETDPQKFDTELFKMSLNSRILPSPSFGLSFYGTSWRGIANDGTRVVAVTGVSLNDSDNSAVAPRAVVLTNQGLTFSAAPLISGFSTSRETRGIIHAAGMFYVFGDSGRLSRSSDGVSWSSVTFPTTSVNIQDLVYNGSVFIAVAFGVVFRSTNGTNWSAAINSNIPLNSTDVTFDSANPSTWVVGGGVAGNGLAISTDNGLTWAFRQGPADAIGSLSFLFHGNGFYYAMYNNSRVFRSVDLVTWERIFEGSLPWRYIFDAANGVFVSPSGEVTTDFVASYKHSTAITSGQAITRMGDSYFIAYTSNSQFAIARTNATPYAGSPSPIDTGTSNLAKGFVRIS